MQQEMMSLTKEERHALNDSENDDTVMRLSMFASN